MFFLLIYRKNIIINKYKIIGGKCVMKMDHHCPWINTCVGWGNHAYFTAFLAFSVIGSVQAAIILGASFYRGVNRSWYVLHINVIY